MNPSVHDNFVYAYAVDCERRRVVLHTAYRDGGANEYTDVLFHDVLAHRFDHVLPGNILFDVDEIDPGALVRDEAATFADSWRHGWPPVEYRGDLSALARALCEAGVRAYVIHSSYGLTGWVLAGRCDRLPRAGPATVAGAAGDVPG